MMKLLLQKKFENDEHLFFSFSLKFCTFCKQKTAWKIGLKLINTSLKIESVSKENNKIWKNKISQKAEREEKKRQRGRWNQQKILTELIAFQRSAHLDFRFKPRAPGFCLRTRKEKNVGPYVAHFLLFHSFFFFRNAYFFSRWLSTHAPPARNKMTSTGEKIFFFFGRASASEFYFALNVLKKNKKKEAAGLCLTFLWPTLRSRNC